MNRKAERPTAPAAQNAYLSLRFDNVRFPIVNLTSRFARRFIHNVAYFPPYVVDGYLRIFERRKPAFYPYAGHRKMLHFQSLVIAELQVKVDPLIHKRANRKLTQR